MWSLHLLTLLFFTIRPSNRVIDGTFQIWSLMFEYKQINKDNIRTANGLKGQHLTVQIYKDKECTALNGQYNINAVPREIIATVISKHIYSFYLP